MCACETSWRACARDLAKPERYTVLSRRVSRLMSSVSPVAPVTSAARSNVFFICRSRTPYMRRAFCFSRSWSAKSETLRRRCWCMPGGELRFSNVHFVKHFSPFRNSFMPSRRQMRQTGPVYLANYLDSPSLRRPAPVVRDRRDIGDRGDLETGRLERADRGFSTGPGSAHEDLDRLEAEVEGLPRRVLGGDLRGVGRALARALPAGGAGRGPRDDVPRGIGERHDRVVERRLHVRRAARHDALLAPATGGGLLLRPGLATLRALTPALRALAPALGRLRLGCLLRARLSLGRLPCRLARLLLLRHQVFET